MGPVGGLIGSTEGIQHSPHVRDLFEGVAGWIHPMWGNCSKLVEGLWNSGVVLPGPWGPGHPPYF